MKLKLLIMMVIALPMANSAKCPTKCRCNSTEKAVSCTNMHLTRFPQGMPNGTQKLDMSGNDLTEVTPDDVVGVPNLRTLYLTDNRIAKITSGTLGSMPKLGYLDLSGNPYSPSRVASEARIRQYREIQDDREYMYDGFLAYNNQDLPWVRQHLLPALEEEGGLQLCLHDRNWLPGVDIMDNIVTSIENSRKTVMVVSNAFASSQWCQLELTMAQHRLFEKDRNNLVLILLEDIDPGNMTPRLALQMRSRTYVQWTEDPMGQRLFWKKLNRTLMKPDRRVLQNPYAITT